MIQALSLGQSILNNELLHTGFVISGTLEARRLMALRLRTKEQNHQSNSLDLTATNFNHNFVALNFVLSALLPSSACSATVKSGNFAGMILLGTASFTTEYFEKSITPT